MPKRKVKPKLKPGEIRYLRYINQYGVEVVLPEKDAGPLHNQMKKFLGDQYGDKTPPKNVLRIGQQERDRKFIIGSNFSRELEKSEFEEALKNHEYN